jgi:hypothetical protein
MIFLHCGMCQQSLFKQAFLSMLAGWGEMKARCVMASLARAVDALPSQNKGRIQPDCVAHHQGRARTIL